MTDIYNVGPYTIEGDIHEGITGLFKATVLTIQFLENDFNITSKNEFQKQLAYMARHNNHNLQIYYSEYLWTQSFAIGLASR